MSTFSCTISVSHVTESFLQNLLFFIPALIKDYCRRLQPVSLCSEVFLLITRKTVNVYEIGSPALAVEHSTMAGVGICFVEADDAV